MSCCFGGGSAAPKERDRPPPPSTTTANPVASPAPVQAVKAVQPDQPAQAVKAVQAAPPAQPAQPAQPVKAVQPEAAAVITVPQQQQPSGSLPPSSQDVQKYSSSTSPVLQQPALQPPWASMGSPKAPSAAEEPELSNGHEGGGQSTVNVAEVLRLNLGEVRRRASCADARLFPWVPAACSCIQPRSFPRPGQASAAKACQCEPHTQRGPQ